jgi:hypothetical protein
MLYLQTLNKVEIASRPLSGETQRRFSMNINTSYRYFWIVTLVLLSACGPVTPVAPISPSATAAPSSTAMLPTFTPASTKPFLDFDHPRLHEIAGDKPLIIDEMIRTNSYDESPTYVAVIIKTSDQFLKEEALIFRMNNNRATLIYDSEPQFSMTFEIESVHHPEWLYNGMFLKGSRGFFIYDKNNIALAFIESVGNCYDCSSIKIIGITDKGEAVDITPKTNFTPKGLVDINERMWFRIVATQYYEWGYGSCNHVNSPFAFRLFAWKDTAYIDVSENEKEFYDRKIAELTIDLKASYRKPLNSCWVMPTLANIFFDYESSGRAEYGWEQIKSLGDLSHWDVKNTPPEELQTYHEVFDELEKRLKTDNP